MYDPIEDHTVYRVPVEKKHYSEFRIYNEW